MQKCCFVRASCGADNPVVVHPQGLPATILKSRDILTGGLETSLFWAVFCIPSGLRLVAGVGIAVG